MMFNWLTYCLTQLRQHECRSVSVTVKLTDSEMWDAFKREWENMILKLKDEMKEKLQSLKNSVQQKNNIVV